MTRPAKMPLVAVGTMRSVIAAPDVSAGGQPPSLAGRGVWFGFAAVFLPKRLQPASPRQQAITHRQATARTGWPSDKSSLVKRVRDDDSSMALQVEKASL